MIKQGWLVFGERRESGRELKAGCFRKEDDYVGDACLGSSVVV